MRHIQYNCTHTYGYRHYYQIEGVVWLPSPEVQHSRASTVCTVASNVVLYVYSIVVRVSVFFLKTNKELLQVFKFSDYMSTLH